MSRQFKWLLIMAAGLAVFGVGQLGDSLATQPGGGEAHHGPPGAPTPPPPTAPPAPPPTVTVPGTGVPRSPPVVPPPPGATKQENPCQLWGGGTTTPTPTPTRDPSLPVYSSVKTNEANNDLNRVRGIQEELRRMEAAGEDYRTGVLGIGGDQLGKYQPQPDKKKEALKKANK